MLISENAAADPLAHPDQFVRRHIGPNAAETQDMLKLLGHDSLEALPPKANSTRCAV
jgi:glycine cleavage system pyridoxal-binding protein P